MPLVITQRREILWRGPPGTTGQFRSLHQFLREKQRPLGVRLDGGWPSLRSAEAALPGGGVLPFRLLSLPLYLCG